MTKSFNKIKNLGKKEMDSQYTELKTELMKLQSQVATRTLPEKPGRIRQIKRTVARILTIKKQKEVKKQG